MATTALIIGALATAGSAAYSANQAKKAAGAAGGKPDAALYSPVDYGDVQQQTLLDNYRGLDAMGDISSKANQLLTHQDLQRAERFVPGFKSIMHTQAQNAANLVNGQLPYDDVLQIAGNSNQLSNAMGTPGTSAPGTLRDLGLSQLQGIQTGQGLLQGMVGIAEQVSPINRYSRPQDFLLYPSQTVPWEIEQQQLIQQSQQSANNIAAGAAPKDLALAAGAASGATNPYSGIGPAIGSIGGAISSPTAFGGQTPGTTGGYPSYAAAASAAPYAGGYTYNPTMGYTPRASAAYSIPAV